MLTGQELAAALRSAMKAKNVTQATLAREFGVQRPSVNGWLKSGRIDKRHIDHVVRYFSDVLPPEHWGLSLNNQVRDDGPERPYGSIAMPNDPELRTFIEDLISSFNSGAINRDFVRGLIQLLRGVSLKSTPPSSSAG